MAKTVGLALGGGGARGWAHVGVLRALEEADIKIDYLAGTSIGALVGAIYVADALDELENFAAEISVENLLSFMDVSFPNLGLMNGERVYEFISKYVFDRKIEDTKIPFRCVATNFLLKEEVVFQSGKIVDAVRASISIPGIFTPFRQEDVYLVDGGVVNPVPVNIARAMGAEIIIAVNLNKDSSPQDTPSEANSSDAPKQDPSKMDEPSQQEQEEEQSESGIVQNLTSRYESLKDVLKDNVDDWMPDPQTGLNIFDVIGNSFNVMEQRVTRVNLQIYPPDLLIEPDLIDYGIFDFHQSKPMMQRGYDAAKAMMPEIKEVLEASGSE